MKKLLFVTTATVLVAPTLGFAEEFAFGDQEMPVVFTANAT